MSSEEFKDLIVTIIAAVGGGKVKAEKASGGPGESAGGGSDAKLDQILNMLGGGAPSAPPAM